MRAALFGYAFPLPAFYYTFNSITISARSLFAETTCGPIEPSAYGRLPFGGEGISALKWDWKSHATGSSVIRTVKYRKYTPLFNEGRRKENSMRFDFVYVLQKPDRPFYLIFCRNSIIKEKSQREWLLHSTLPPLETSLACDKEHVWIDDVI